MPERLTSISKARAKLPRLSQTAQKHFDRYIITLQGQPQSVLIGYDEYQTMKAAVELMQRPDMVEDIKAGLKELDEGKGVPLSEMKAHVRDASHLKVRNNLAEELAAESGVDSHTIETVMGHFGEKMLNIFSAKGSMFIPGVGEIVAKKKTQVDLLVQGVTPLWSAVRPGPQGILKKGTGRTVKSARAKQAARLPDKES
jgi:PHD/YefM family antitoxin component YafN of YafNO toxin-antitoxin module